MEKSDESPDIAEIVREGRSAMGWTQERLAREVGTKQQTIEKIEKRKTRHSRYLPDILQRLGISLDVLAAPKPKGRSRHEPPKSVENTQLFGPQLDFPVHGAAEGGRGAIIVTTDPVEYMVRPQPVANVRDAYGIIVIEASMEPEFRPGDVALVNPHLPPRGGHTCVFYSKARDGTDRAVIKNLRRSTGDLWHVQQWNPKRTYTLKKSEWQTCHVTVGRYDRR